LAVSDEPQDIMRDFNQLQVWQKARRFVHDVCRDAWASPRARRDPGSDIVHRRAGRR
jgi:hypothetical protein